MTLNPPQKALRHLHRTPLLPKEELVAVTGFWLPRIFPNSSSLWVYTAASEGESWTVGLQPKDPDGKHSKRTEESVV